MLSSLPGRGLNTNPYLLQLLDALAERSSDVTVQYFSWRRALLGRYDVLHVHWPERLVRGSSAWRTAVRRAWFVALLARLTAGRRAAVVRTLHNVASHEAGGRLERWLLTELDRRTDLCIRLNPYTPLPAGAQSRTIVHGHYRDWFPPPDADAVVPGRILFFGLLRAYKGVEELLDAFVETEDPAVSLRLVGSAQDETLRTAITEAERRDSRISSHIAYVPDEALAAEVAAARLVVLPYRAVHNSGAAILALSLARPVLMPRTDTTTWLQQEVGERWMLTYDAPLTASVLATALGRAATPQDEPPELTSRNWPEIAVAHIEAFRAASRRR